MPDSPGHGEDFVCEYIQLFDLQLIIISFTEFKTRLCGSDLFTTEQFPPKLNDYNI